MKPLSSDQSIRLDNLDAEGRVFWQRLPEGHALKDKAWELVCVLDELADLIEDLIEKGE